MEKGGRGWAVGRCSELGPDTPRLFPLQSDHLLCDVGVYGSRLLLPVERFCRHSCRGDVLHRRDEEGEVEEDEGWISFRFCFQSNARPTAHFPQRLRITSDLRSPTSFAVTLDCHTLFIYLLPRVVSSAHQY